MPLSPPLRPAPPLGALLLLAVGAAAQHPTPQPQNPADLDDMLERLEQLDGAQAQLRADLEAERQRREADAALHRAETEALLDELEALGGGSETAGSGAEHWYDRMSLGGYGESHFNFREGPGGNQSDIHRFVLYVGYAFADWIRLNSEIEIEHALIQEGDGEVSIEQLYLDFLLEDSLSARAGRLLAPLGLINQYHEPTSFNGVERPGFDRVIVPTTWALDGVGIFGNLGQRSSYELNLTNSLDGSGFTGMNAVRGGRMKERPGLNEPALSGRFDFRPFAASPTGARHDLRLGGSFFHGGYDNGDQGVDPGLDGDVSIFSVDAAYSVGALDFRAVGALGRIDNAAALNEALTDPVTSTNPNVGSRFQGWYVEGAWHLMPERWKTGKLERSDIVAFLRYERYDTQASQPANAVDLPAADRQDITAGLGWWLTPNLVLKADYQFLDDASDMDRPNAFNLGLGWLFQ